jgi:SAM-dependent methyltransferase
VEDATVNYLNALNRQFYQTLGAEFSATRRRIQPGVRQFLAQIPASASILDLGCGNGELARQLARQGFIGAYIGLDFSSTLLDEAKAITAREGSYRFLQADLTSPEWAQMLAGELGASNPADFDFILAFASLHHLPGKRLRLLVLRQARALISPVGRLIHSEWMFLNSPRMRARILPWEIVSLDFAQVDPGDYLLDWKMGGYGLRYVHHFSGPELDELASQAGFQVKQVFLSDGEGGKLSCYQVWLPAG